MVIAAVGRLRQGPEATLIADYLDRHAKAGRALGLPPVTIAEVEDKRGGGMAAEAALLDRVIPSDAALVTLDERGQMLTSPEFADRIAGFRDQARDIAFVIGGADGIDPALRARMRAHLLATPPAQDWSGVLDATLAEYRRAGATS